MLVIFMYFVCLLKFIKCMNCFLDLFDFERFREVRIEVCIEVFLFVFFDSVCCDGDDWYFVVWVKFL